MKLRNALPCNSVSSVVHFFYQRPRLLLLASALLTVAAVSKADAQTFAPAERFVGMLADGTRIQADSIKEWHVDTATPQLAGHAVFDPARPVRWFIDQSVPVGEEPSSYVELFGGDRLPCRVIEYQRSPKESFESLGEYLVVEPLVDVDFPGRPTTPFLRVSTEWLKRIVFDKRAGTPSEWHPGTVFLHDGSRITFRVVRWSGGGLSLLTESGIKTLLYSQVSELHLPRRDEWDVWFEQLAVLNPDLSARMIQAETSQGMRITVSTERFSARHSGDHNKSENWYPLLHPAWSLDPVTLPFRTVRTVRFFAPEQSPMSNFEPMETRAGPVFSAGWNWVLNFSVQSSVLRNNRLFHGWGFGVHAPTTLAFPLHPVVREVRCQAGLDQMAGPGGCVRAVMALQSKAAQPFYQSEVLVGHEKSVDSGWRAVTVPQNHVDSLLLIADPVFDNRPKGADPFDIRDCLDWLEPEWKLDRTRLQYEVSSRSSKQLPALDEWVVTSHLPNGSAAPAANPATSSAATTPIRIRNAWDRTVPDDERSRLLMKPSGTFVVFSQRRQVEPQHHWLAVSLSKPAESTDAATVYVRVDGHTLLEAEVPVQVNRLVPDPILVPVSEFQGRESLIEIVLVSTGEKSFVDWRGVVLVEHPPGIALLFDESDDLIAHLQDGEGELSLTTEEPQHGANALKLTSGDRSSAELPGFDFAVREYPKLGEYRFLRFAWKKKSGTRIGFQLAHDCSIGVPENEFGRVKPRAISKASAVSMIRREQTRPRSQMVGTNRGSKFGYQYDAGTVDPVESVMRLDRKMPVAWTMNQRDLFGEFGSFTVTGLGFQCSDAEPAYFDQIFLFRQQSDFKWIDEVSGTVVPVKSDDPNLLVETREPLRFAGVISKVAPQFVTTAAGEPLQLLGEYQGRQKVCRTMPVSKEKACLLRAPYSVVAGKKTVLKISAGRHPEGDWQLVVRATGQELFRSMVDATTAKEGWLDTEIDLSRFAGQSIIVEVANEATGWSYEHGYWNRLEIVEQ